MRKTLLLSLPLALTLPLPSLAERIPSDALPGAVLEGFRQKHPDAADIEVDKESHFGQILYEIKFKEHGHHSHQSLFDAQGQPFGHEEAIAPEQLPSAVRDSLHRLFKSFQIRDVEAIRNPGNTATEYEIDLVGDGRDWEIVMSSAGDLLSKEKD